MVLMKSRQIDVVISRVRTSTGLAALLAVLLTALVASLAGCGDESATSATLGAPSGGRLEIAETEYDFGQVPVGETVTHSFRISNSGDGELRLGELQTKMLEGC